MKLKKCICVFISMFIILGMIVPNSASASSNTRYGVLIGNKSNYYTLYEDLTVISPSKNVMVKAYAVCKELGLSYSYDKDTKKLIIKNKDNGRYLVFVIGSKTYTYYSGDKAKGSKKTAAYKCYYDKENKCSVIHVSTLQFLLSYDFFQLSKEDDYYDDGYRGMIVLSKYVSRDDLPIIAWKDKNFEKAIRKYIGIPTGILTRRDLSFQTIDLSWSDIKYIDDVKYIPNVKRLALDYNEISDIDNLPNLPHLVALSLEENNISDISILSKFTNLGYLELSGNDISDISILSKLANLWRIGIDSNYVTDISCLQNLKKLKSIVMGNNMVEDISVLSQLPNINELYLQNNPIKNIESIEKLDLTSLIITDCEIKDSVLKNMKNIRLLTLKNCNISNIQCLSNLTNLELLELNDNKISDITPIKKLVNLTELDLSYNNISDFSSLKGLKNLTKLYLVSNNIININSIQGLSDIVELDLSSNNITDISALGNLKKLSMLNLVGNNIIDYTPVSHVETVYKDAQGSNEETINEEESEQVSGPIIPYDFPDEEGSFSLWLSMDQLFFKDNKSMKGLTKYIDITVEGNVFFSADVGVYNNLNNYHNLSFWNQTVNGKMIMTNEINGNDLNHICLIIDKTHGPLAISKMEFKNEVGTILFTLPE